MKFPSQKAISFLEKVKSDGYTEALQALHEKSLILSGKTRALGISALAFLGKIKSIGITESMEDYEKRKLSIFNQLNFFQLVTGILIPFAGLIHNEKLPAIVWLVATIPAFTSVLVLWLNSRHDHQVALITYFIIYPLATGIVYLGGINMGVELSFILYGILSVFFIQDISQMLFALGLSMVNYFILAVVCKNYTYHLATANIGFYFFNQLLAIAFIFYGLFLIKEENAGYQSSILYQKEEIAKNEKLLQGQTGELTELNALKNKLFSVIAHDIKSPMYALRNLFRSMQQCDLPAEEIKMMIPEVLSELNSTTSLMENLLQWARTQMQADSVKPQLIDMAGLITEVVKLLRLQAETKQITVNLETGSNVFAFADKEMVNLVLRNFLSNAIKFTPERGLITLTVRQSDTGAEVSVKDTGKGISEDDLRKINLQNYYTTKGTANESGTGLGLMLCKEFLARNGGKMHIESQPGQGSMFSFTLPGQEQP